MDHYDKIVDILDIPYFKNLITMGIDTVHYGEIFKRMYNDTITIINNREIINEIGEVIYYENSDGEWYKKEYDDNGNEIYYENSNGYWFKKEFNGNIVFYINSLGEWVKKEFNNGKVIYYEDSNGISERIELESENKLK